LIVFEAWPVLLLLTCGLVGMVVGSFLNVVIYRWPIMFEREWRESCVEFAREHGIELPAGGSSADGQPPARKDATDITAASTVERFDLWWPPSACPACGKRIKAWQNVPILSFLLLKGRCAHCRAPISKRYPLVEAFTALASIVVAAELGPSMATGAALVFTWYLIALSLIDFDTQFLPDSMTLPLLWLGLLLSLVPFDDGPVFADLRSSVIGAAAGYLSLWSVNYLFTLVRKQQGMGAGDFKLLAAIGAWLGWQMLLPVILFASAVGALVGIGLIALRKHAPEKPIPFGPYLAGGGWIALLWGANLVDWYLGRMF
jgi:leader peptidase (prepilin peptidase)/N-methyltransferase